MIVLCFVTSRVMHFVTSVCETLLYKYTLFTLLIKAQGQLQNADMLNIMI